MWKRIISEMSSAYLERIYFGGGVCLLQQGLGYLRRGLGFPKVLASSLRGGSPEICGRYGRGAEVWGLYGF